MDESPQLQIGQSISWGWWVIALLVASIVFLIGYSVAFGLTIDGGTERQLADFQHFRIAVLSIVPFAIVMLIFFLGLYSYSLYVDLFNCFSEFTYRPITALLNVLMPVINIYGIGLAYVRVINYLDQEDDNPDYARIGHRLKLRLAFFYAGLAGVLISLLFSLTLPGTADALQMQSVVLYTIAELVLIFWTLIALLLLIVAFIQLVRYRRREMDAGFTGSN